MKYKGYELVRRHDIRTFRWLIVGTDGWTVARANTIKKAKAVIDKELNEATKTITNK